jgi:hypothetical protein
VLAAPGHGARGLPGRQPGLHEDLPPGPQVEPAVLHLARWGSRTPLTSDAELSADALILALRTTFDPAAAGGLRARYELRLGEVTPGRGSHSTANSRRGRD